MARIAGIGGVFFKTRNDHQFTWILDPDGNKVELWEPLLWDDANKAR